MLRIYFMQQWYDLSDPAMEDRLYDVGSMRRFAGVDLDHIPDETTICKFRHFLERHRLTSALFRRTEKYLSERGLLLSEGTIVDATIVQAPSSTKNRHLWGYRKVRYRGLAKNAAQIFTLFALANFYLARHELRST